MGGQNQVVFVESKYEMTSLFRNEKKHDFLHGSSYLHWVTPFAWLAESNSEILGFYWLSQKAIQRTGKRKMAVAAWEELFFHSDFAFCSDGDTAK